MKNMKIEINAEQPLDEVVKELERLGYKGVNLGYENTEWSVYTDMKGLWSQYSFNIHNGELTTLQQLREMKCELF